MKGKLSRERDKNCVSSIMEEDKENVCNVGDLDNNIGSTTTFRKTPPDDDDDLHSAVSDDDESSSESTTSHLLMVSPPPNCNPTRKTSSSSSSTTATTAPINGNNITNGNNAISPPPPANSETILSAFRQVEHTLNAEIHTVRVLAGVGTSEKPRRRRSDGTAEEDGNMHYATSPESDVDRSPIPPSFPPMPSSMTRFRSPGTARNVATTTTATATRTATRTSTDAAATTTPMDYSSLSKTPKTFWPYMASSSSSSPLVNKSLLPLLTKLESTLEDGDSVEDEVETEGAKYVHRTSPDDEVVAAVVASSVVERQSGQSESKDEPAATTTTLPMEEIEFQTTSDLPFDSTPVRKQSKVETDVGGDGGDDGDDGDDDDATSDPGSPLQPMDLYNNNNNNNNNSDDESAECGDAVVLPSAKYRRRIIESQSDDKEEEDSSSVSESEQGNVVVGDGSKEDAVGHPDGNNTAEEDREESARGDEGESMVDISKLDLNDDDDADESVASSSRDNEDDAANVDGRVHLQHDRTVPSKAFRRRIIIDDEEDDDDDDSTADGGTSDVVSEGGSDEGSRASRSEKSTAAESEQRDIIGEGLSGLTLDDANGSDSEEEVNDPSFRESAEDDDSTVDSKEDVSVVNNTNDDDSVSIGDENDDDDTDESESMEEDDDESLTCFDACGCWTLYDDESSSGDLYLSNNSDGIKWPEIRLPLALYNKLFQHQRIGVQWMASLHRNEIKGGLLADDMGMGKTMQVLSYLGSLMRAKTISNAIVICPKSVVRSWEREANLILKNMCVKNASIVAITSDMSKEKRKRVFTDAFCCSVKVPHLVITTYGLASNHIADLSKIATAFDECHWGYVVLDEGHLIKNRKTKTSTDMRILASRSKKTRRLLLTGTPIQNNMRELHALFDWATNCKLLGSIQTFLNKYGDPIEEGRQRNASDWTVKKAAEMNVKLKKTLAPYFLQRLKKTTFDNELPEKKEIVVFTQLSAKQRSMYEDFTSSIFDGEAMTPLAAISWLKMLCGHPSLIKEASRKYKNCDPDLLVKDSSKLEVLLALLHRLRRSGHRALVFSQSTKMLDIIEKVVMDGSISFLRIDGSTAQNARQKYVDHFNDSACEIDIMLLSTKAAGTGLTLTGADRAIIYDPSWNPAEDAQAVDRCYRIGQTKNVKVYRFIAAGTVEEKMYEKQVHKDGIKRVVLSSDRSTARYFDQSELADLFKLAPPGECTMLQKFNEKSKNSAPASSSGKPSFLSKHPSVIGVASHDILYSAVPVDVDLTSPRSAQSAEETPFSRSPFQKAKLAKTHSLITQVEDLTMDSSQVGEGMKPLGGYNQTRQIREDAKAKRNEENCNKSLPIGSVSNVLRDADTFIMRQRHDKAMSVLLDLTERGFDLAKGNEKLAVHEKISQVAHVLGWL